MVTKFKIFEKNDWEKNYIVIYPTGEIIYYNDQDEIYPLLLKKYIYKDSVTHQYASSTFFLSKIKNHFDNINIYKNKEKIMEFLNSIGLEKDHIKFNSDNSVDVYTAINIKNQNLNKIPIKFGTCYSDFNCSYNMLTTLENSPRAVHGNFDCSYNKLYDLKGGPTRVYRLYNCSHNDIQTLIGGPNSVGSFNCSYNYLTNLHGLPRILNVLIKNNNLLDD